MARIRSIKPEFWTDSLMVQMPPLARLLYIGLWNQADDHGALPDEPDRICMEVLPREDPAEVEALVDLLISCERLSRMVAENGDTYLQIEKWSSHQKVDKPSKSRFPREGSRKVSIPAEVRRRVAQKYGCDPGQQKDVTCYVCGSPGTIYWHQLRNGKPSSWVSFSGLEIDHFEPESRGGETAEKNIVLTCRQCNRSRGAGSMIAFISALNGLSSREPSITVAEGTGKGEGIGGEEDQDRGGADAPLAFVGRVIRLKADDYERWRKAYPNIRDLKAELTKADDFYSETPPKDGKWFFPVSRWLAKANDEAKTGPPSGRYDPNTDPVYRGVM